MLGEKRALYEIYCSVCFALSQHSRTVLKWLCASGHVVLFFLPDQSIFFGIKQAVVPSHRNIHVTEGECVKLLKRMQNGRMGNQRGNINTGKGREK